MNKAATSREQLLDQAKKIVYAEGISKLSIRRVAEECGVAIGTVYNYYPAKSDLILAVMEEFWRNVFHGQEFPADSSCFLESYEEIFYRMKKSLSHFRADFLEDVSVLDQKGRKQGKRLEEFYWKHMKAGMLMILERDRRIKENVWNESFTREGFIQFAFAQLTAMLRAGDMDCSFFLEVIKRLLYS